MRHPSHSSSSPIMPMNCIESIPNDINGWSARTESGLSFSSCAIAARKCCRISSTDTDGLGVWLIERVLGKESCNSSRVGSLVGHEKLGNSSLIARPSFCGSSTESYRRKTGFVICHLSSIIWLCLVVLIVAFRMRASCWFSSIRSLTLDPGISSAWQTILSQTHVSFNSLLAIFSL